MTLNVDRSQLERELAGALKSTIAAHGPITWQDTGSASKRLIGVLKTLGVFKEDGDEIGWPMGEQAQADIRADIRASGERQQAARDAAKTRTTRRLYK